MFLLDIIFVPIGLFMLISPSKFYDFIKRFKSVETPSEGNQLYFKHIRLIGIGFLVVGIICTVLTFKYNL